jgi:hypothetical protein
MAGETDVFILGARNSDHCPVFVHYGDLQVDTASSDVHFKFEASWMVNDACSGVVTEAWRGRAAEGDPLDILHSKLDICCDG